MEYDQTAVDRVASIERSILKLHHPHQAEFVGIINAIELQVEYGKPVLTVVQHLADALLELARQRGVRRSHISELETKLERLQKFLHTGVPTEHP